MLSEYILFAWIIVFTSVLGLVLVVLNILATFKSRPTVLLRKEEPYECGFDYFDEARVQFDIRYYLIAILFLLFDIEIIFLLPQLINLANLTVLSFFLVEIFAVVLTIGFVYEYKVNALEWESL